VLILLKAMLAASATCSSNSSSSTVGKPIILQMKQGLTLCSCNHMIQNSMQYKLSCQHAFKPMLLLCTAMQALQLLHKMHIYCLTLLSVGFSGFTCSSKRQQQQQQMTVSTRTARSRTFET
jgi:hypothetical protein